MTYDAIVIGGGLMGCSTALQLAMRKQTVVVLEKDSPGRHASGVNAGGLRRLNRHRAEIPLAVAAMERWHRIVELLDSDCDTRFCGQVRVAENEHDLELLEARAADVRSWGFDHEQMIGRDELYRLVPNLADHCVGALYTEGDGFARPFHALTAFRRKAESLGVEIVSGCRVDAIDQVDGQWLVKSADREFTGRALVNAAGAWSSRLCEMIGEPVPLEVGAPMMMVTERVAPFIDRVVGAASRKLSFKQMQNGTVLIGGAHLAGHDMASETTEIDLDKLRESSETVVALFPFLKDVRIVRTWAGLEAFMPDNLPVISPSAVAENIYHAFGFSAHGFALSPIVGEIVADLVTEGETGLPIEAFSVERFQGVG